MKAAVNFSAPASYRRGSGLIAAATPPSKAPRRLFPPLFGRSRGPASDFFNDRHAKGGFLAVVFRYLWIGCGLAVTALSAEPTEMRSWVAKSGHKMEARALQVENDQVQFERAGGVKIAVPLAKLSAEDQEFLTQHFAIAADSTPAKGEATAAVAEGEAATDLPHPLGNTTGDVPCGGNFHCLFYFPNSLRKGAKHPVIFVMSPIGGGGRVPNRYIQGAERNRWIIAVSKESSNNFGDSQAAVDAMIKHVTENLPVDPKRLYTSGFSGGSRMAFATARNNKNITGVIACGAGGNLGSPKQSAYGLCGSNCFNRTDMANSFRGFKGRDNLLRYFPGMHEWASDELCDDAITHLNGVFLLANRSKYPAECAFYIQQVTKLINECRETAPQRALMWASFLAEHNAADASITATRDALAKNPQHALYLKGLTDVSKFAQKTFGEISASQWKADPKVSAACKREAQKYTGTPWEEILGRMAEDAQQF